MEERLAHLASFPELNPNPLAEVDLAGYFYYLNPAAKQLFPDLQTRGLKHPWLKDLKSIAKILEQKGETSHTRELKIGELWYQQNLSPVFEGRRLRIYGLDITERKQMEEELERSKTKYRIVADNTYDCESWINPQGRYLYMSPSCKRVTGYDAEDFIKKPSLRTSIIHPDDREMFDRHIKNDEKRHKAAEVEYRIRHTDGSIRWIAHACQPVFSDTREYLGIRVSNRDITERKETETKLQDAHRLLQDVVDSTPSAIFLKDREGKFITINATLEKMLEMTREELRGKTDYDIATKETAEYWRSHDLKVMNTGQPIQIEEIADLKDGHHIFLANKFPLVNASGQIYGVCGISHDITERKRADEMMRTDLEAMTRLHKLGTLFVHEGNLEPILNEIVDAAIAISGADFGNIQILDRASSDLKIVAQRGFPQWWLDFWNSVSKGKGTCGTALGRGERVIVEDVEQSPIFAGTPALEIQLKAGIRAVQSTPLMTRSGKMLGMFSTHYKTPHRPDERTLRLLDLLARQAADIIDRMQAEETLRRSGERYRGLYEAIASGIVVQDRNGSIVEANPAASEILGLTQDQIQRRTVQDHHWQAIREDGSPMAIDDRPSIRALRTGIGINGQVMGVFNPALEEYRWLLVNAEPILDPKTSQVQSVVTTFQDITDRKKKEEELQRLNRTLTALSKSSQAMMRAEDEFKYMQEVCEIVVKDCGHKMVWMGLAEEDEAKSVRPVAHAGFEEGYLETLHITWADTERGRGPTGTAIRMGKASMCRNMLTDPNFAPWRSEAIKRGYASSITLPLMTEGKAFGAITIYSKVPDPFSKDEIKLLQELADDLAHGITALNLRAAHAKAEEAILRAKEEWERTFDAVPDLIAILDDQHRVLRANRAMAERLGVSLQEFIGKACYETVHGLDRPQVFCPHVGTLADDREHTAELHEERLGGDFLVSTTPLHDAQGQLIGTVHVARDITERKQAEEALKKSKERFELLSETASELLATDKPQEIVNELCEKVMAHLDCDAFFNYLVDVQKGCLHLNAYAGIPEEAGREIEWLDYGIAVCGCAARDASRIVCENIPETPDIRTEVVKSFGIKAYACHPLFSAGMVIGTLSFGTRTRTTFAEDDLSLMKTVADQVAIAMERVQLLDRIRRSRDELEVRVQERTAELRNVVEALQDEMVERRQTEEALRGASIYARSLIEASIDPLVTISPEGKVTDVNNATELVTGISREQLIGSDFSNYFTDPDKARAGYQKVFKEGSVRDYPLAISGASGQVTEVLYNASVYKNEAGEVQGVFAAARDITEQKAAEQERLRLISAIEQSSESIVITDDTGKIVYVNPAFSHINDYPPGEAMGKNYFDILTGDGRDRGFKKKLADILGRGLIWEDHFIRDKKDGTSYELEVTISPVREQSGNIINYSIIERDVTRETILEQHLRQQQKMEALGTLAGGIAHDFNNILMPIMINTELSLYETPQASPINQYLKTVLEAAQRGQGLVKQIIAFSRQKEQEREPIQLAPIIKETLKFLKATVPQNVEIREHVDVGSGMILGDPTQIHQVLMNLCSNAAYAMREKGGELEVSLANVEVDTHMLAQHLDLKPGPYLKLVVSDTGHGMSEDIVKRIFDPFFTTKKPGEGAGMGLAVVHGIVKRHEGAIITYSEPGKGATFNIFFPRIEADVESKTVDLEAVPMGTERILFVDDEEVQCLSGRQLLERLGYTVMTQTDGLEALKIFQSKPDAFDLVITDQNMPRMIGTMVAEKLMCIRADIPIILCTGFSEVVNEKEAKAMGIREFMMKPFSARHLAETIRRVLDGRN
jgi:PAS domain S-box-containing protein